MDRTVALLRLRFCLDGPARSDHRQPFQLIDRLRELEVFGRPELEAWGEGFGIDLRGVDFWRSSLDVIRSKIEEFVGTKVYLDLWVKVLPNWRKSDRALRRFGYRLHDDHSA